MAPGAGTMCGGFLEWDFSHAQSRGWRFNRLRYHRAEGYSDIAKEAAAAQLDGLGWGCNRRLV